MPSNEYMKIYMSERRLKRRNTLLELAGGKCAECDEVEDLEFNHLDRTKKSFGLSGKDLDRAWKTIMEEFEKCNLLCRTHHEEYTASQYRNEEIVPWNKNLNGDYVHGSARTYNDIGCRCDACKTAKRMYRNKLCSFTEVVA